MTSRLRHIWWHRRKLYQSVYVLLWHCRHPVRYFRFKREKLWYDGYDAGRRVGYEEGYSVGWDDGITAENIVAKHLDEQFNRSMQLDTIGGT